MDFRRQSSRPSSRTALAALLGSAAPAIAAMRFGTNEGETLVGAKRDDQLNGKGGNDSLRGLGGNEVYFLGNGWGEDVIDEGPRGGTYTVNLRAVTGNVAINLVPEWQSSDARYVGIVSTGSERVAFAATVVENAVGARGDTAMNGGGAANTYAPGGGSNTTISDYGGWSNGADGLPGIRPSNDVYRRLTAARGLVTITDWAGSDAIDLRPLELNDVYLDAVNLDASGDGSLELLQMVADGATGPLTVVVLGRFAGYLDFTTAFGQEGQIERIVFADRTLTIGGRKRERALAERAPSLLAVARRLARAQPEPGEIEQP